MEINLTQLLQASSLAEAANIARLLEGDGELMLDENLASREELVATYETRLTHLAQFDTHHAKRLLRATQEFVDGLQALPDATMIAHARLDDPLLGGYVVWFVPDTQAIVGCMYVIGRSEVPEDVWASVWQA